MTQAASKHLGPAAAAEIVVIRVYQWTLRPFIGANCRFWPSCSDYAVEALRRHGALKGTAMATRRILRCNPWHEGGVDPVPGSDCSAGCQMGHSPQWDDNPVGQ